MSVIQGSKSSHRSQEPLNQGPPSSGEYVESSEVFRGVAQNLPFDDCSFDLVCGSPPYNTSQEYADGVSDDLSLSDYYDFMIESANEIERVLKPGGRAFVNVPPAMPFKESDSGARLHLQAGWARALGSAGLLYRDTVIWLQGGHDGGCAWGSVWSPNAVNLRGGYEVILVFFKETWSRGRKDGRNEYATDYRTEWPEHTRNVWTMPTARRDGHPAPFPEELPRRAILLSTWAGDSVLDPWAGVGTTVIAAAKLGREGIGIEPSKTYVDIANHKLAELRGGAKDKTSP